MDWSDLHVIDTRKIATPLTGGGDLSVCPDGPVAVAPRGTVIDPSAYGEGLWVSVEPMAETVKELDADGRVAATIDRAGLLTVQFPIVVDGSALRACSGAGAPQELLRELLSGAAAVRVLEPDPAGT